MDGKTFSLTLNKSREVLMHDVWVPNSVARLLTMPLISRRVDALTSVGRVAWDPADLEYNGSLGATNIK